VIVSYTTVKEEILEQLCVLPAGNILNCWASPHAQKGRV